MYLIDICIHTVSECCLKNYFCMYIPSIANLNYDFNSLLSSIQKSYLILVDPSAKFHQHLFFFFFFVEGACFSPLVHFLFVIACHLPVSSARRLIVMLVFWGLNAAKGLSEINNSVYSWRLCQTVKS